MCIFKAGSLKIPEKQEQATTTTKKQKIRKPNYVRKKRNKNIKELETRWKIQS